jgi:hypothetical protein
MGFGRTNLTKLCFDFGEECGFGRTILFQPLPEIESGTQRQGPPGSDGVFLRLAAGYFRTVNELQIEYSIINRRRMMRKEFGALS